MLSKEEYIRYSRHFNLPGFGPEEQLRLKKSKVLVVGAGGLGSPLLLYLAAAGVGQIGIIDDDIIDLSNLQRQVLYRHSDIGRLKAIVARDLLRSINPEIEIRLWNEQLTTDNAREVIAQFDVVADGTDNFPTRYLVNDACVLEDKINVYASVFRYEGQVSVFNYPHDDGARGPNYRDICPFPPAAGTVPDCATGGVLGILPGVIGTMQATEVLKVLTGLGTPLVGQLLLYDALTATVRKIKFPNKTNVRITNLINYEQFCGVVPKKETAMAAIREITVHELKKWRESGKDHQLIDVREQHEWDFVNIDGDLIPLGEIMNNREKIATDKDVVLICRTGKRSWVAVDALQKQGFDNLFNLKGGITAWAKEIDPSMPTY